MRKMLVGMAALALAGTGTILSSASAETVGTPIGSASTDAEGYTLLLDGDSGNQDPVDGFVGIGDDNSVQCSDEGDGYIYDTNGDGVVDEDDGEPERYDGGCHPENQLPS